jgi:ABC-type spermidine/putrescine transport system permease subunit I
MSVERRSEAGVRESSLIAFVRKNARYFLILPPLIVVILFLVVPSLMVLLLSFNKGSVTRFDPTMISLDNFIAVFSRPSTYIILRDTLGMSVLAALVTLLVAYPVAYFLSFKIQSFQLQGIILFILVAPYWVDWSIRSISWLSILGEKGLINYALMSLGLIKQPLSELLFTRWTLLIIWVQTNLLFMIFPIYLSLTLIDPDLINVARTLGASPFKAFTKITFRLSLPGVVIGIIFVFIGTLGDYVTPALWAGGLQMLGLTVQNYAWHFNWPMAAAYSVLLLAVTLGVIWIVLRFANIKQVFYK